MIRKIRYTRLSKKEMGEIADYLAIQSRAVSLRFFQSVHKTAQFLARASKTSEIGTLYESDDPTCQNIRLWRVDGFSKYLIFYRVEGSTLKILRVLHGSRDYRNIMEMVPPQESEREA